MLPKKSILYVIVRFYANELKCNYVRNIFSFLKFLQDLGMFVNILTADGKYFLRNSGNLRQPIQIQLSKKQNISSKFIAAFLKSSSNFAQI